MKIPYQTPRQKSRALVVAFLWLALAWKANAAGVTAIAWGGNNYGQTNIPPGLTNMLAIAAGANHNLVVRSDTTVAAWGNNANGRTNVPPGLSNVVAVAGGEGHSMALRSDSTVVAWGDNSYGQTNIPAGLSNVVAIAAGAYHSLALRSNGTVVGWGYNYYGQSTVPSGLTDVVALAEGSGHSVALRSDGTVIAWGYNGHGETDVPLGLSDVVAIAAGANHSLALRNDGTVIAWGYSPNGETSVPSGLNNVIVIAAGANHSLAVRSDGSMVAWGYNNSGQINVPAGLSNVVAIAGGGFHSLALVNDGSPIIVRQPVGQTAYSGTTVTFSSVAAGVPPLSYQWQWNGTNLAGATNTSLTLTNVQPVNAGTYRLVVTNALGSVTSFDATLAIVFSAPVITVQPTDQQVSVGSSVTFAVQAEGSLPIRYRWRFNETDLLGATNASLTLMSVPLVSAGSYQVVLSNAYGVVTSSNAILTILVFVAWGLNDDGQTNIPPGLSNVLAVAAGANHNLAVRSDTTVAAWGNNANGQTNVPPGLSNVVAVAGGEGHSMALKSDGRVVAWGNNSYGQTNVPVGLTNVVAIGAGERHSLALKSGGTVVAWGYNNFGQTNVPPGLMGVTSVAAGLNHCLALRSDGTIVAWGYNAEGETDVPTGLSNVVAIAAGGFHNLALKGDGTVVAWGFNGYSQIDVPAGLSNVVAIAGGWYHSLAVRSDGTIVAWGNNSSGQINVPTGLTNAVAIAAGGFHSLALVNGGAPFIVRQPVGQTAYSGTTVTLNSGAAGAPPLSYQWHWNGTNLAGATNASLTLTNVQPVNAGTYRLTVTNALGGVASSEVTLAIVFSAPVITVQPADQQVSVGSSVTFPVQAEGSLPIRYQWRFNETDLLGATNASLPLMSVPLVSAGSYQVVLSNAYGVVTSSNATLTVMPLVAWGNNDFDQTNIPPGLSNVMAIEAGAYHNLALKGDGSVAAWGNNDNSQTDVPPGLSNIVAVAAGNAHSLALRNNGTVAAWGYNVDGETNVPPGLSNVVAISAGAYHSLALRSDGTVIAWGYNGHGETNVPAGLSNVTAISAGGYHNLVLRSDGTVTGWGYNAYGQSSVPVGLSNIVAIAGGGYHSLALRAEGTVAVWGYNGEGQTTVPAGLSNVVAIAAGERHSLALRSDGAVVAWGQNSYGQISVPPGLTNVVAVAGGVAHTLALVNDGAPFILRQPVGQTAYSGTTVTFSSGGAVGVPPLSYQWQMNGTNLAGATSASLTLTNVQPVNAGVYRLMVTNALGGAASFDAILTVLFSPPILTVQPTNQQVSVGGSVTFAVQAIGSLPISGYQWRFNGAEIPGATNASLTLTGTRFTDAGAYNVVVSNAYGVITSSNGTLTVTPLIGWGDNSYGQTNIPVGLSNVTAVAGGESYSLALKGDGALVAWGENIYGQTNTPPGLSNAVAIAAGGYHSLALKSDGKVVAWGNSNNGRTAVPVGLSNVVAIAAGGHHSLALKSDGVVVAWGYNANGQTDIPSGLSNAMAIAAGWETSFVLRSDGTVVGNSNYGLVDVPVGLSNVVAISAGVRHGLALKTDGTVVAWGYNEDGQTSVPTGLSNVVAISAGAYHSLALRSDGSMLAWGANNGGQINVPVRLTNVVAVAGGGSHTLALVNDGSPVVIRQPLGQTVYSGTTVTFSSGAVGVPQLNYQWQMNGTNLAGATNASLTLTNVQPLNAGTYRITVSNTLGGVTSFGATLAVILSPPIITVQPTSQQVSVGGNVTFAVQVAGSLPISAYQWRFNGAEISGATNASLTLTGARFTDAGAYNVVVSNAYGTALSSNATLTLTPLIAWGYNADGQTNIPAGLTNALAISAGAHHNLALRNNNTVVAWGRSDNGQTNVPAGLSNVVGIAAGVDGYHNLALRSDGMVVGWGYNAYGQSSVPVGLSNVVAVAAGGYHSLALRAEGTVAAWGYNGEGQTSVPSGLSNVLTMAAGERHSLALRSDGSVVAWGYNNYGQANVPLGLNNMVAVAAGVYHSLALGADGTVTAWGYNGNGQTNVPAGLSKVVAVAAGAYHSLALRSDGSIVAWGYNNSGQINISVGLTNVVAIAGGWEHTLVLVNDGSPFLVRQLLTQTRYSGSTAILNAGAIGISPLSYQWQFNGTNLVGATNAVLALTNVQPANAGIYRVTVTNTLGSVTTTNAVLTVIVSPPIVTLQPTNQTIVVGTNVLLGVQVVGSFPISYQWRFNGANISGATNSLLILNNAQFANEGTYSVVVTNAFGSVTSTNAFLNVADLAEALNTTNLVWTSSGNLPWFFQTSVTHDGVLAARSGAITHSQQSVLQTTVAGLGSLSFWWKVSSQTTGDYLACLVNGVEQARISGNVDWQQKTFYLVAGAQIVQWVYLKNNSGSSGQDAGWVDQVSFSPGGTAPIISVAPINQTSGAGLNASFSVAATGTQPLSYQWRFNGANLVGATNTSLTLSNVQANNAGTYSVAVGNAYGVTTPAATLTVTSSAPVITLQPSGQSRVIGSSSTFRVAARGSTPLTYQWLFNGADIAGETNPQLTLAGLQLVNAGNYRVVVSNTYGTVTSSVATLKVSVVAAWGYNGVGQTNIPLGLSNVVGIAAGQFHNLVVKGDGTVVAWGYNNNGQTNIPPGLSNVVAIAAGYDFNLALQSDGSVAAWGDNAYGQVNVPAGLSNVVALAGGGGHSLALRNDGSVVAWGLNASVPAGLSNLVAIAAGESYSLALKSDGSVVAWGAGQTNVPVGLGNIMAIAAGAYHSLALRDDGTVVAWGNNDNGRTDVPPGLSNVVAIAAGGHHSLALRGDGSIVAWGYNSYGQINVPSVLTNVVAIAGGWEHTLALVNDGSPFVARQPLNQTAYSGTTIVLGAGIMGLPPLSYQWQFNGTNLIGATTNAVLTLTNVQLVNTGSYRVVASNALGTVTTSNAVLTVIASPPLIVVQPTNQVISVGANVTLAVAAVGSLPLSYQWRFNGTNLAGAAAASLTLTNIQLTDEGSYDLVVSNAYGVVTSTSAFWDVRDLAEALDTTNLNWTTSGNAPWLWQTNETYDGVSAARSGTISTNQQSTLQTVVNGPGTLDFWWMVSSRSTSHPLILSNNGAELTRISGEVNWQQETFYLGDGAQTLQWVYSKDSLSGSGQDAGWVDEVSFVAGGIPPTITNAPVSQTLAAGLGATFSVGAWGTPPLGYQWQFNGGDIAGATNTSLSLTNVQAANAGTYNVTVSNSYGMAGSNATLTVTSSPPVITVQPSSQSRATGGSVTFAVTARGSDPLTYQWQLNAADLAGATSPGMTLTDLQSSNAGIYRVIVSNTYGAVTSLNATLTVGRSAIVAWGVNGWGEINVPAGLTSVLAIAAGYGHSLALRGDGTVVAWGVNDFGQSTVPIGLVQVTAVAAGAGYSLALKSDGTVVGWGYNANGQISVPPGLINVAAIAAGLNHNLVLKSDGTVIAWGSNTSGKTNVPPGLAKVVAVTAGIAHSLALRSDGRVVGWGDNTYGQTNVPPNLSEVVAISAGHRHSLALKSDGTVVAWGLNTSGQTNVPPGLSNIVAIAAGGEHNLALRNDGTVVAWGYNSYGQVNVPPDLTNAIAVSAGQEHSLALVNNGAPFVTATPQDQVVESGTTLTLEAAVIGAAPFRYQWQFNGNNIAGATNAFLMRSNVPVTAAGDYRYVVSNALGSVTSAVATLTVTRQPLRFDSSWLSVTNGGLQLRLLNLAGAGAVVVEASSDLVVWTSILTNVPVVGVWEFMDSTVTNQVRRFYRASEVAELVAGPLRFDPASLGLTNGSVRLLLTGLSGRGLVVVYASSNLVVWESIFTHAPAVGVLELLDGSVTNRPARFYRAEEQP